jgi:hypothetical protein
VYGSRGLNRVTGEAKSRLEMLEHEIMRLDPAELASFRDWYSRFDSEEWDRQIQRDILAGKLDALAEEALLEHGVGKSRGILRGPTPPN